ncbi:putative lipase [Desulfamplus magnetovallimortis]|uniref:Putative lipase n=1 Tax=Desulfamplus magnetovallimortis TaxID=1246637 RepID=A0A1W1HF44_9BACT|nr:lipase family protein [Desulfamplus magnetovallimortis]SLM31090.1 putative lipase [Desulfamplus magnetovallimortis]
MMAYSYAWRSVFSPGKAVDFFPEKNPQPFETGKRGFSRTNAWWLSELSRLIYVKGFNEIDIEQQTKARNYYLNKMGLEEKWFFNGKYVQCAIIKTSSYHEDQFSVLVFRGTQGRFSNWYFNLHATLSPWPSGGEVHRGFKLILMDAWEAIQHQLDFISEPVYYTGHSLGGALAVLAASLKKPEAVYTFGSPRMGNRDFIESTKDIGIYRVVTPRDIVAGVPPFPAIQHVGQPCYLANPSASDSQRSWFQAPGFLADHSPLNYTVQL